MPGTWVITGNNGPEYMRLIKEVAGSLSSGLVGFHIKGMLTDD